MNLFTNLRPRAEGYSSPQGLLGGRRSGADKPGLGWLRRIRFPLAVLRMGGTLVKVNMD